ncbi:hypothetical protein LK07_01115 [Streptomyces pluripotens]|uniref:Uncharacterized protein n=1 Tax=Streptomyces pluripotens TaxID=1355015 RepID=A0A221NSA3_9ACTN|nr:MULTISPECIES: hypothetical protein [Streptomyces]ARP68598.1 hypothetical protein LK06_000030 [Streptomyces pluripotens]ASN22859.1 hypothetical protein LK07_01115 [Streptomyces pluripotens]KIE23322.1 hypothetical protein LK08_30375 [Streptomyces sp. MUSC 125]MCH0558257.1 hypothetical protein [Streptomyces sp. MUM 16J]
MQISLTRAAALLRDVVSGRRRVEKYSHAEAHRNHHNRDAGLAHHYIPTAPQLPIGGVGGR